MDMSPTKTKSGFRRSVVSVAIAACLLELALPPAFAQAFGDAFSSQGVDATGVDAEPYVPTKREKRLKPEPPLKFNWTKTPSRIELFDGSLALNSHPMLEDPFCNSPDVELSILSEEYFAKDDPFVRSALGAKWPVGEAPRLTGATNGPHDPPVKFPGLHVFAYLNTGTQTQQILPCLKKQAKKVLKPAARSDVSPLRQTLHDIWVVECKFQPFGNLPTQEQMAQLKSLYTKASALEPHPVMKNYYRFMAQMAVENIEGAWSEIEIASKQSPYNSELFDSFAEEFDYISKPYDAELAREAELMSNANTRAIRAHYKTGMAAVRTHNWSLAWKELEAIYSKAPDADQFIKRVALQYSMEDRDKETHVWLTRLLRVAQDWETFEHAYDERAAIELRAYMKFLEKEPKTVAHWNPKKIPLKIYFPGTTLADGSIKSDSELQSAMEEALMDWAFVVPGKLDYLVVDDEKQADIVCVSETRQDPYKEYIKPGELKNIPQEVPHPPASAQTFTKRIGDEITSAKIVFYSEGFERGRSSLKELSLHEAGHALGYLHHSRNECDIMYGIKFSADKMDLTSRDKAKVFELYKNHPFNKIAMDRYVGLQAICHRLGEPLIGGVGGADGTDLIGSPQSLVDVVLPAESTAIRTGRN